MWLVGVFDVGGRFLRSFSRYLSVYGMDLTALKEDESYDAVLSLSPTCPKARASVAVLPGEFPAAGSVLRFKSAVTYGMSSKDTVTASSVAKGKIVVSVRRDIICLTGAAVERQEVPLLWDYPLSLALPLASLVLISGGFSP